MAISPKLHDFKNMCHINTLNHIKIKYKTTLTKSLNNHLFQVNKENKVLI